MFFWGVERTQLARKEELREEIKGTYEALMCGSFFGSAFIRKVGLVIPIHDEGNRHGVYEDLRRSCAQVMLAVRLVMIRGPQ